MAKRKAAKGEKSKAKRGKAEKSQTGIEFNHAMVYVRDLAQALKFYEERLGFRLIEQHAEFYARLRSPKGGTSIALHKAGQGEQVAAEGTRLYFEVKELDKFCAKLEGSGVKLSKQPQMMPWGWRHAYLNDPDGHEISLYWAGKKRFQKTVIKQSAVA
jgi:catechol 2,3-dioxygenase-like lactoylglutathione lyase family enzyme